VHVNIEMEQAQVLSRIVKSRATLLLVAAVLIGLIEVGFVARSAGSQSHAARPHQGGQIVQTSRKPVGSWTTAASLPVPDVSQAALLLANGDVLMTGGEVVKDGRPTSVVQRYHTAAGTWSTVAAMRQERIGHTATLLKDGRVLVVGGLGKKLQPLSSVEIYDPVRDRWASTVPLPDVRFSHSATRLPDGRVLVVGGIVHGAISRSVLIFDPRKPSWRAGPPTLSPHAQQDALALPDGRVLIAGGYGGKAEVYDPRAGTWTAVGGPDDLAHPVLAFLRSGDVLLATGVNSVGQTFRSSSLFDPTTDRWNSAAAMATGRDSPSGAELRDGRVLVAGGAANRQVLRSAEIYDARTNRWDPAAPMRQARSAASALLLRNGSVLVCGGSWYGTVLNSCELYHP
jgi:WD40 repeat protein